MQDGIHSGVIEGKILKVTTKTKTELPDVFIQIETEDNEILFAGFLTQKVINVYPIHETIKGDISKTDYYYSMGNIHVRIVGMKEGDKIEEIKVLYEYEQIVRVSE